VTASIVALSAFGYQWLREAQRPQWQRTVEQANELIIRGPEFSPRAEVLLTQALNSATAQGATDSEIERINLNLARLYDANSRPESAAKCLEQALVLSKRQKDDPLKGQVYDELCKSYERRQDWKHALESATEAVSFNTKRFGEASEDTEYSLSRLAEVLLRRGDLDEAQQTLGKDIAICRQLDPKQKSLPLAHAYENLSLALVGMHEPSKNGDVEFNANRALNIYMEILGKEHPNTKHLAAWFTKWLRENGLVNDAAAIEEKVGDVESRNGTLNTRTK
jgi:tetratricopeptide (TPR) repeat protein